jgi:ammonia channel protein AmtB
MQAGLAFREAGSCRYKNTQGLVIKMMLNAFIGIVVWWTVIFN